MKRVPLYVLVTVLLGLAAYLKSSIVAVSTVLLWSTAIAEVVLLQKNKDTEIVGLVLRMEKIERTNKELTTDITNVAERAKTILGEQY